MRLDRQPPQVGLTAKARGMIIKNSHQLEGISQTTAKAIAEELGIKNAEIIIKEPWKKVLLTAYWATGSICRK